MLRHSLQNVLVVMALTGSMALSAQHLSTRSGGALMAATTMTPGLRSAGAVGLLKGGGPPNDECTDVTPQLLEVGATVMFSGDNTGATQDLPGFTLVWEAFTTDQCANVMIDYCVPGSEFSEFMINLAVNCPDILDGLLAGAFDECTLSFTALPAGTYYIPVAVGEGSPQGPYTIALSSTPCSGGYCSAGALECDEYIARVQFGAIDNSTDCADGPAVDHTALSTSLPAGSALPIVVTNGPAAYEEDQVVVWVDWDQNESFLDPGESFVLASTDGAETFTGSITAPPDALPGATRMRIRMMWTGTPSPCGYAPYGEVEDYTVAVIGTTGLEQHGEQAWLVYPNPGNGDLTLVHLGPEERVELHLLDMSGRTVHTVQQRMGGARPMTLQLAGRLAPGMYVLRGTTGSGMFEQRVLVH